jgi:hypothetical protein
MILGGKVAADFRAIVEGTFTRVMAGDKSLIEVINANAASQAPVQQAFRAALEQEPVEPALDAFCLGQKRERDELDTAECRLRLEQDRHELEVSKRDKALEHTSKAVALTQSFTTIDERTKLQFGDHIKNVVLSSGRSFAPTSLTQTARQVSCDCSFIYFYAHPSIIVTMIEFSISFCSDGLGCAIAGLPIKPNDGFSQNFSDLYHGFFSVYTFSKFPCLLDLSFQKKRAIP